MGRAPCCEKMGLKKGPWTPDEDHILVNYIRLHGHNNWRALPKQAGLLRCGKSCRLRWTNYLRPDIKRGNFTQDEEETIIKLHEMLGNRWSAIAARLPGRTDNEIKNVWHTHLKKRLPLKLEVTSSPVNSGSTTRPTPTTTTSTSSSVATAAAAAAAINVAAGATRKRSRKANVSKRNVAPKKRVVPKHENSMEPSGNDERTSDAVVVKVVIKTEPVSPQPCTSDVSTVTSTSTTTNTTTTTTSTTTATTNSTSENDNDARLEDNAGGKQDEDDNVADVPEINDDFWMEVLSVEDTAMSTEDLPCMSNSDDHILVTEPFVKMEYPSDNCEDMDVFWHNLLTKSHEILEITEMV